MSIPSIGLTKAELKEVTGYTTPGKQISALAIMGIPFKVRPNGTPFVARATIEGPPEPAVQQKLGDWTINM